MKLQIFKLVADRGGIEAITAKVVTNATIISVNVLRIEAMF